MKKITLLFSLCIVLFVSHNVQGQGLLNAILSKKTNSSSTSSDNKTPKSDMKIVGVYNSLTIGGKARGYQVMPIFSIELTYDNETRSDGTKNTTLETRYTENGRSASGPFFTIEKKKDEIYSDGEGFAMKLDENTVAWVQLDRIPGNKITINDVLKIELWSKDKALLESIKAKGTPYKYTEDEYLMGIVNKALALYKGDETEKGAKDIAEWEQANKYVVLPEVSAFQPANVKKALPEIIKNAMTKYRPYDEMQYYYLGIQPIVSVADNYTIIKEPRRNDLGLDKIVTKRAVSVVVVSKMANGTYSYNFFQVFEDVQPGVFDGSKFTGQYYITGIQGPYGITQANAMLNKGK